MNRISKVRQRASILWNEGYWFRRSKIWLWCRLFGHDVLTSTINMRGMPLHPAHIRHGCLDCKSIYTRRDGQEYGYSPDRPMHSYYPVCKNCEANDRDSCCQTFAAMPLKADVGLNEVARNKLLLEVVPNRSDDRKQFFVSRRANKYQDVAVVREFETREIRPQGGTWEGSKYDRGFYESPDTMLTFTVEENGYAYMCIWLNHQVITLLEPAEKVVVRSFKPFKGNFGLSAAGPSISVQSP